jgi:hypothetical protein
MSDLNPYQSPLSPASSRRNIPLHLMLRLVATVLFTPVTIVLAGLLSYAALQVFAKIATNSQPTTDPLIILTAFCIFIIPPAVTFCGMTYWILTIFRAIAEIRSRDNAVNKKTPAEAEV